MDQTREERARNLLHLLDHTVYWDEDSRDDEAALREQASSGEPLERYAAVSRYRTESGGELVELCESVLDACRWFEHGLAEQDWPTEPVSVIDLDTGEPVGPITFEIQARVTVERKRG